MFQLMWQAVACDGGVHGEGTRIGVGGHQIRDYELLAPDQIKVFCLSELTACLRLRLTDCFCLLFVYLLLRSHTATQPLDSAALSLVLLQFYILAT